MFNTVAAIVEALSMSLQNARVCEPAAHERVTVHEEGVITIENAYIKLRITHDGLVDSLRHKLKSGMRVICSLFPFAGLFILVLFSPQGLSASALPRASTSIASCCLTTCHSTVCAA